MPHTPHGPYERWVKRPLDAALVRIYGADMDKTAPALAWYNEVRQVCAIHDDDYIPQLLEVCEKDEVDLVVPTIDT